MLSGSEAGHQDTQLEQELVLVMLVQIFYQRMKLQASLWGKFLPQVQKGIQLSWHSLLLWAPGECAKCCSRRVLSLPKTEQDNLVAMVAMAPCAPARPGWELWLVSGVRARRSAQGLLRAAACCCLGLFKTSGRFPVLRIFPLK